MSGYRTLEEVLLALDAADRETALEALERLAGGEGEFELDDPEILAILDEL